MKREAWRKWRLPAVDAPADMYGWQDGRCAMCGKGRSLNLGGGVGLVLDHCHMTGLARGFLCRSCNSQEGRATDGTGWDAWRNHDTPARAVGHIEIYETLYGNTAISPSAVLHHYSLPERQEWWASLYVDLEKPDAVWPVEAPWTDAAVARRLMAQEQIRSAMSSGFAGMFGGAA